MPSHQDLPRLMCADCLFGAIAAMSIIPQSYSQGEKSATYSGFLVSCFFVGCIPLYFLLYAFLKPDRVAYVRLVLSSCYAVQVVAAVMQVVAVQKEAASTFLAFRLVFGMTTGLTQMVYSVAVTNHCHDAAEWFSTRMLFSALGFGLGPLLGSSCLELHAHWGALADFMPAEAAVPAFLLLPFGLLMQCSLSCVGDAAFEERQALTGQAPKGDGLGLGATPGLLVVGLSRGFAVGGIEVVTSMVLEKSFGFDSRTNGFLVCMPFFVTLPIFYLSKSESLRKAEVDEDAEALQGAAGDGRGLAAASGVSFTPRGSLNAPEVKAEFTPAEVTRVHVCFALAMAALFGLPPYPGLLGTALGVGVLLACDGLLLGSFFVINGVCDGVGARFAKAGRVDGPLFFACAAASVDLGRVLGPPLARGLVAGPAGRLGYVATLALMVLCALAGCEHTRRATRGHAD